ncbi:MAG: tetratricopeptide repeat protein [Desulfuromusa sp.]|nr:tetratricopeptide repeat protein [Desulfuromusa sp.]
MKSFIVVLLLSLLSCATAGHEVSLDSQQATVHYQLAVAHLEANNPTLALKELLVAVQQDPESSAIQVVLAQTYQRKKAYSLAEKHYLIALELSENDPRYQNNLASLYLDMERWDEAIGYFDQASKNLLFVSAHVAVAGKAYAYFKKMDYLKALEYATDATKIAPRYASAYYLKSEIYRSMGDLDQEEVSLLRAIDIAPRFFKARYQLAILLLQKGLLEEAAEQLNPIVEFSPTSELGYKAKGILKSLPE